MRRGASPKFLKDALFGFFSSRRRESPAGATPRRLLPPRPSPRLPGPRLAPARRSSPPAGAIRAGRGARGSAPASRAVAPRPGPAGTQARTAVLPEASPASPGRKPGEGARAPVSARTGGAGRPRSEAGPAPPAAVRRSAARAARRTRAVASLEGLRTGSGSGSVLPLRAASSRERRGGTRAPAVSAVVLSRGRASTARRTTSRAPRACRAGCGSAVASARRPRLEDTENSRGPRKKVRDTDLERVVAWSVKAPSASSRVALATRFRSVRPSQPRCPA